MKRVLYIISIVALCFRPAAADDMSDAAKVVKDTVGAALECLGNKDLPDKAKEERILDIINPVFDFPLMGKLALGRLYWPKLNETEKEEYAGLFVEQLRSSYADKIALFSNETVEYEDPVRVKSKIHVSTMVISKNERHRILYKLYRTGTGWKVYDIEIQGVSIVSSYRAQYAEVLKNGAVEDLLKKMREQVKRDDG